MIICYMYHKGLIILMNKQKIWIVVLTLGLLLVLLGYAIYSKSVDVKTYLSSSNKLSVEFYKIGDIKQYLCDGTSASISKERDFLEINVPNLKQKGAYTKIPVVVKNVGEVPVKLLNLTEYSYSNNDAIKVAYSGVGITDIVLMPGETTSFDVTVTWENDFDGETNIVNFGVELNYVQEVYSLD